MDTINRRGFFRRMRQGSTAAAAVALLKASLSPPNAEGEELVPVAFKAEKSWPSWAEPRVFHHYLCVWTGWKQSQTNNYAMGQWVAAPFLPEHGGYKYPTTRPNLYVTIPTDPMARGCYRPGDQLVIPVYTLATGVTHLTPTNQRIRLIESGLLDLKALIVRANSGEVGFGANQQRM